MSSYPTASVALTCIVAILSTAGVVIRPLRLSEALWPLLGAGVLLLLGLLTPLQALIGMAHGVNVYLFLAGMLLLSEVARHEGLFGWLAAIAVRSARGSSNRLFLSIFLVGVVVTTFMSNDATAVVLTPAVAAAVRAAKIRQPLPYLLICAFVANAASFVLPISNPANLVIYGVHLPPLLQWLPRYLLPSILSIAGTYAILRWTQRNALRLPIAVDMAVPLLSRSGKTAMLGIIGTLVVLLTASACAIPLGLPTALAGAVTAIAVLLLERRGPLSLLRDISWDIIPLVAGLFILVESLDRVGLVRELSGHLQRAAAASDWETAWTSGLLIAGLSNLTNNLPAALVAGDAIQAAHSPDAVTRALLIGVDLGPNISVTGSLATILWLSALRREGIYVSAMTFLRLGLLVTPLALLPAIGIALVI